MSWTRWRKLADRQGWYDDVFDYDGPCCYELATGGPRGGDIQPHYVGETSNEKKRMCQYGRDGSHLSRIINRYLKDGWSLYYHAYCTDSKEKAVEMERNLLARHKYDWNSMLNGDH
jgi:hypothetical protein